MDIQRQWYWTTHRALLQTMMKFFNPEFIVEMGMGEYSTPLFMDFEPNKYLGIENDIEWFDHMKGTVPDKYQVELHTLPDSVTIKTFPKELTDEQRGKIVEYYLNLGSRIDKVQATNKFLFVDHFTCARAIAINILGKHFDLIAYHDCEPAGVTWYEYYFNEYLKNDYNHYELQTPKSWAGAFIKKEINQNGFIAASDIFIAKYCDENGLNPATVNLVKKY